MTCKHLNGYFTDTTENPIAYVPVHLLCLEVFSAASMHAVYLVPRVNLALIIVCLFLKV